MADKSWKTKGKSSPAGKIDLGTLDRIESDRKVARLETRLKIAEDKAECLAKEVEEYRLREEVADRLSASGPTRKWPISKPSRGKTPVSAIVNYSDWHLEENVDKATVNGLNEYNPKIAERRVKRIFEKTADYIEWFTPGAEVLYMGLLGDFITGYIHEELLESNHMAPIEAADWAVDLICSGVEYLRKRKVVKRIISPTASGNHGRCHDSETELLTRDGWKKYHQVRDGETVATFNMDSRKGEWQPLKDFYSDIYDGPMVHVKTAAADWCVTPQHRMVLCHDEQPGSKVVEMQGIPDAKTHGSHWFPKCANGSDVEYIGISDDELRLVGWLLTDGNYCKNTRGQVSAVRIYQSKPPMREKIRLLLERLGFEFSENERRRKVVAICGKTLKSCLPEGRFGILGKSRYRATDLLPDRKRLPDWVWELSERQVRVMLEAIKDGNGAQKPDCDAHWELHGTEDMLNQIQSLLMVNGVSTRLRWSNRGDPVLSIRSTPGYSINSIDKHISVVPYKGAIWCGTVENGTLITRRNGVPLISGNSTPKKRISTSCKNSFEWGMYRQIARLYRNDPFYDIRVCQGYHMHTEIYGRTVRWHHGDAIRFGGGVGGITIPANKKIAGWNDSPIPADLDIFGHLHTFMDGGKFVANGSVIGHSPYGVELGAKYEPPCQSFIGFSKTRGKFLVAQMFCED